MFSINDVRELTGERAECPRKSGGTAAGDGGESVRNELTKAPGMVPTETLISCTYMYYDKTEVGKYFSDDVLVVLNEIIQRLKQEVRLNLILDKVNCAEDENEKCVEYSLHESFHWLIVDDPKFGAAIYEINEKLNNKPEIIEASLLDALSRHSDYDLTPYCSKEATNEVGFIRRLSTEELIAKRRKPDATKRKNIIARSPFELDLIEPILLELRTFEKTINWHRLECMNENSLNNAIGSDKLTFVLFWNNESIVSQYAFYLWAEASESLVPRYPNSIFGAVACHEFGEFCEDYVTKANEQHTVFVFKENAIFGKNAELRDSKYYIDWVHRLIMAPVLEINSDDELKQIKAGKLKLFDEIVTPITVGIFGDCECKEAKIFMQVADNLKGKYHFVQYIKNSHSNTVYTIRVHERKKRIDFTSVFDVNELTDFVVRSSLPSVFDISNGFTSDILMHQRFPVILLLGGSEQNKLSFSDLCAKMPKVICTSISNLNSKVIDNLLHALKIDDPADKLIIFLREKIYMLSIEDGLPADNLLQLIALAAVKQPLISIGMDDIHPLRYLQLAQINEIFGEQTVEIPAEVQIIQRVYKDRMFDVDSEGDDYGGCPVMAKARQMITRDEL